MGHSPLLWRLRTGSQGITECYVQEFAVVGFTLRIAEQGTTSIAEVEAALARAPEIRTYQQGWTEATPTA
jgi:hypothetical protein